MKSKLVFRERQKLIFILALLVVGVVVIAPTMPLFAAEDPEIGDPKPDVEPNIIVSASHTPQTVYPNETVLVTATYQTTFDAYGYEEDNSFILSQTDGVTIVYDDGVFEENHVTMTYDSSIGKYKGVIPEHPAGTTITYTVMVYADSTSGVSGANSYYVSYIPEPYEPPPPDVPDPQDVYPPSFMVNDVILADGQHITWSEFLTATVWGTIRLSVTFLEGGNNIATVNLKAMSLETGVDQWFSFGRAENDPYTWILDWDTTQVADGDYGMTLRMGVIPEGGGGGGETGVEYAVMAAFGFGDGIISTMPIEVFIIVGIVFVGMIGIMMYKRTTVKSRKRRKK